MFIESLSWTAMILVYLVVHNFSAGKVTQGNCWQIAAAIAWGIVAFDTKLWAFLTLNIGLFVRSSWMLWKEKEEK